MLKVSRRTLFNGLKAAGAKMKAISHLAVVAIVLAMGIERADEQPDILKQLGLDPATMTPEDFYHVMENFREGRAVYDVPSRRSQQSSADADEIQAAMVRREQAEQAEMAKAEELRSRGVEVNPRYDLIDPYGWR